MKQSLYDYIAGNYHNIPRDDLARVTLEALYKLYIITGDEGAERDLINELREDFGLELEGVEV
jgi:hypothetical protein